MKLSEHLDVSRIIIKLKNIRDYEEEDANSSLTLANRLRIAFANMQPDTICGFLFLGVHI